MGDLSKIPSRGAIRAGSALHPREGVISGLALHPQGHRVVSFSGDIASGLTLWSLDPATRLSHLSFPAGLADLNAELPEPWWPWAWRFHTEEVPPHALQVAHVAASQRGDDFAVAAGRAVRLVRISDDDSDLIDRGIRIPVEQGAAARVALSRDASRLLVTDTESYISVWSIKGGSNDFQCVFRFRISRVVHVLRFIWADRLALAGDDLGRITCWELESGQRHLQFQAHHEAIRAVDFCPHQKLLASAGDDRAVRLWDLENGSQAGKDMKHLAPVLSVAFAGGGAFLLTSCADGRVVVWDTRTCEPLDTLTLGSEPITLAVSDVRGVAIAARLRALHVVHVDYKALQAVRSGSRPAMPSGNLQAVSMGAPPSRTEPTTTAGSGRIGDRMPLEASGEFNLSFFDAAGMAAARPARATQALQAIDFNAPPPSVARVQPAEAVPDASYANLSATAPQEAVVGVSEDLGAAAPVSPVTMAIRQAPPPQQAPPQPAAREGSDTNKLIELARKPTGRASRLGDDDTPAVVGWSRAPEEPSSEPAKELAPAPPKPKGPPPAWIRQSMVILGSTMVALLLGAVVGGFLGANYVGASDRGNRVARIEERRQSQVDEREAEFETIRLRQENHVSSLASRGAGGDEIARARENADRVLAERRAEADNDIDSYYNEAQLKLDEISEERVVTADRGRFNGAFVGAALGFLLGVLIERNTRPKKPRDRARA